MEKLEIAQQEEEMKSDVKEWSDQQTGHLLLGMQQLNDTNLLSKNPTAYVDKCHESYKEIKQFFLDQGAEYFEDVSELYNRYQRGTEPIVIRREDPIKLVQLVGGKNLDVHFDPEVVGEDGDLYANAALWPYGSVAATNGIANAFLEGRNKVGPIAMVGGFANNPEHMKLEDLKEKRESLGDVSRHSIKVLSGTIAREDLEFVAMRMSAKFVEESELTPDEFKRLKEGRLQQIFRGFSFAKQ